MKIEVFVMLMAWVKFWCGAWVKIEVGMGLVPGGITLDQIRQRACHT